MAKKEKVILAYSGGLDTTVIIPWLKENYDYDVICCCVDCGQGNELDGLEERAKASGAAKLYIEDVTDEMCEDVIVPCVQSHAVYENKYLLGTSIARPIIAKRLVEVARKEHAAAICHGATGKGNDQIRFELGIKALAPDLKIIAAWRDPKWTMQSREDELQYARDHGITLPFSASDSYSRDRNIWHISHEGLELEDPSSEPNYNKLLVLGVMPEKAPATPEYVTMSFEKGVPVAVNGQRMKVSDVIRTLNVLGGKHGIGIIDIVENRVVGMKSRGVYETPGGTILYAAHEQLEELILDRETMRVKRKIGEELAQTIYEGKWFTPLADALVAFIKSTQEYVTGDVKFRLYKGNIIKAGETSPYSIYSEEIASFTTGELYDHKDATGFITLFGLSSWVRAMKLQQKAGRAHHKSPTAATSARIAAGETAREAKKAARKTAAKTRTVARETAAKTKSVAKEKAGKAKETVKSTVGRTKTAAKKTATRAKTAAKNTAAKTKNAAKKTADKAKGMVKRKK
ncbi:MAG: argininosuccinate synthase [Lachnospiraceae bacterium]|nr:argininosuccinate synthase [Lachnospiraceae bacterium]